MIDIDVLGVDYPVPSNAADTNSAAKQVAFEQAVAAGLNAVEARVEALEAVTWTAIIDGQLSNGWTTTATSRRAKSVTGVVTLQLLVEGGTEDMSCYTLPANWRPPVAIRPACGTGQPNCCPVLIATDGTVTIPSAFGAASDGVCIFVSFPTS